MEAILKDGTETVMGFDVYEDSHVYVQREDGADSFLDWDDVPDELKEVCLKAAEKLEDALKGYSSASAAVVERYARVEKEAMST